MQVEKCFLCDPPADLVFHRTSSAMALCGVGPVVDGYTVVGANVHAGAAADLHRRGKSIVDVAEEVRAFLTARFGSCLLTEHGRTPVCIGPAGAADPHCFHAHFLLFPDAPSVIQHARSFFAEEKQFSSLGDALACAPEDHEYFLLSPSPSAASVFLRPGRMMPQFARKLVADSVGRPDSYSWRKKPERDKAVFSARAFRAEMGALKE